MDDCLHKGQLILPFYDLTVARLSEKVGGSIKTKKTAKSLLGVLITALGWQIISIKLKTPAIPSLSKIGKELLFLITEYDYWKHILSSMEVVLLGITIAVILGFIVGVLMHQFGFIKDTFLPVLDMARGVSALAIFPLLIVLVGIGKTPRVFIIFWTAWPPMLLSTIFGLNIDQDIVDAGKVLGANDWELLIHIKIPLAIKELLNGVSIGISGGWVALIASEMIGANSGLGYFLTKSAQSFNFNKVYASIITIGFLGGVVNWSVNALKEKIEW